MTQLGRRAVRELDGLRWRSLGRGRWTHSDGSRRWYLERERAGWRVLGPGARPDDIYPTMAQAVVRANNLIAWEAIQDVAEGRRPPSRGRRR